MNLDTLFRSLLPYFYLSHYFYESVRFLKLLLSNINRQLRSRLTKYPLLFENLAKYSKSDSDEEKCLIRAVERSKEIVNRIDEAIKEAADQDHLAEIQKKLDKSMFDKIEHPMSAEVKVPIRFLHSPRQNTFKISIRPRVR